MAMKLTSNDISYVQGLIDEATQFYGNVSIEFFALDSVNTVLNTPYKESKGKKYKTAISLVGIADLKPKQEKISPVGVEKNVTALFEFSLLELESKSVLAEDVLKGKIKYSNVEYDIINLVPQSFLMNESVSYVFECREMK